MTQTRKTTALGKRGQGQVPFFSTRELQQAWDKFNAAWNHPDANNWTVCESVKTMADSFISLEATLVKARGQGLRATDIVWQEEKNDRCRDSTAYLFGIVELGGIVIGEPSDTNMSSGWSLFMHNLLIFDDDEDGEVTCEEVGPHFYRPSTEKLSFILDSLEVRLDAQAHAAELLIDRVRRRAIHGDQDFYIWAVEEGSVPADKRRPNRW